MVCGTKMSYWEFHVQWECLLKVCFTYAKSSHRLDTNEYFIYCWKESQNIIVRLMYNYFVIRSFSSLFFVVLDKCASVHLTDVVNHFGVNAENSEVYQVFQTISPQQLPMTFVWCAKFTSVLLHGMESRSEFSEKYTTFSG